MIYSSTIVHPDHGELLNKTESAKLLGIHVRKFERIAPPPDYVQQGIYPFWSRRVLEILPTDEYPSPSEVFEWGRELARQLVTRLTESELQVARNGMSWTQTSRKVRKHFCGFKIATKGMEPLLAAKWCMAHCSCPPAKHVDVLMSLLRSYRITEMPAIRTEREAGWYVQGFLCQTKRPPISM